MLWYSHLFKNFPQFVGILKEINLEYSLKGLMLKLKLQYFCKELTHWKKKNPDTGKD